MTDTGYATADVVWVRLSPTTGHEQAGRRPAVIVSTTDALEAINGLVHVVPVTTTNRRWPHHIAVTGPTGLPEESFAMTEQIRTISSERIDKVAGSVSPECLALIRQWIVDFIIRESY